jgi:hypothetical protein
MPKMNVNVLGGRQVHLVIIGDVVIVHFPSTETFAENQPRYGDERKGRGEQTAEPTHPGKPEKCPEKTPLEERAGKGRASTFSPTAGRGESSSAFGNRRRSASTTWGWMDGEMARTRRVKWSFELGSQNEGIRQGSPGMRQRLRTSKLRRGRGAGTRNWKAGDGGGQRGGRIQSAGAFLFSRVVPLIRSVAIEFAVGQGHHFGYGLPELFLAEGVVVNAEFLQRGHRQCSFHSPPVRGNNPPPPPYKMSRRGGGGL